MLKWQFQIMREPKCSCLQLNPQMEGFSEAEHASVHFTALKEKQHIFFYRISPTQTEIQSCCASSEENVWARSFAAKQNKSEVLFNRIFFQFLFFSNVWIFIPHLAAIDYRRHLWLHPFVFPFVTLKWKESRSRHLLSPLLVWMMAATSDIITLYGWKAD